MSDFEEEKPDGDYILSEKVPVGTVLLVETINSVYEFEKTHDPCTYLADGGYFAKKNLTKCECEIEYIGKESPMAIIVPDKPVNPCVLTSQVVSCKMTLPDGKIIEVWD